MTYQLEQFINYSGCRLPVMPWLYISASGDDVKNNLSMNLQPISKLIVIRNGHALQGVPVC